MEPCGWPTGLCGSPGDLTADEIAEVEAEAAWFLWTVTGQRFGQCEVTVEHPPCCWCAHSCLCYSCTLYLPGPVGAVDGQVTEVLVNGEPFEEYMVVGDTLVRTLPWPRDVVVTYLRGLPIPPGGARAARELATELALARCEPGKCRLPAGWTSRTRQGDTVQRRPGMARDEKGTGAPLTGLPLVDLWVAAANRVAAGNGVWSPDVQPMVVTAGPGSPGGSP